MSWIFDTHATPGTNPWSWEWGSPESFAGHRPCGCRRCESCKCYKLDISVPRSMPLPPKIVPPRKSAHPAVSAQWAPAASPHWADEEYELAIKRSAAHPAVSAQWAPAASPHWADEEYELAIKRSAQRFMWLDSTCHEDDLLARYYEKYGTFNRARVMITHEGKDNPTAPAKYSKEAPIPADLMKFSSTNLCRATVEESNRGVKRSFPW